MPSVERGPGQRSLANSGKVRHGVSGVVRTLLLWSLVFLLVELALGLLEVNTELLVLAGAAVLAVGAYDVLRQVTMPAVAAGVGTAIGVVGLFMALDEADVAPRILDTLFLGLVLTVAGIAIVAVGGGGIEPMRARWEQALARWSQRSITPPARPKREVDLRERGTERATERTAEGTAERSPDDTTLVPSRDGALTQERIRAEIRSETDTLP